jgi:hypothetical protein
MKRFVMSCMTGLVLSMVSMLAYAQMDEDMPVPYVPFDKPQWQTDSRRASSIERALDKAEGRSSVQQQPRVSPDSYGPGQGRSLKESLNKPQFKMATEVYDYDYTEPTYMEDQGFMKRFLQ